MTRGKFILTFAPTGSGKSVLIEHLRTVMPELVFVKSYTTRARRSALENASYEFISMEEFVRMRDAGEFIEWAEFGGNLYGTRRAEIEEGLAAGKLLFKEMELQGVRQTLGQLAREDIHLVYVEAGSWDVLEHRARLRGSITDEELEKRRVRYEDESSSKHLADTIVMNEEGKVEEAKIAFVEAIRAVQNTVG